MRSLFRLCQLVPLSLLFAALSGVFSIVQAAEVSPKQFYLTYHQKCLVVSSPKALQQWRSKDSIARDQPMSDEEIEQVYPMIKEMMSKNITVISEEIKGDRATLKVVGDMPEASSPDPVVPAKSDKTSKTGTAANSGTKSSAVKSPAVKPPASKMEQMGVVLLIKEDGQWKMEHESWTAH